MEDLLAFILGPLLQFIGEILLQLFAQILVELGVHALAEPFQRKPHPVLASIGYGIFGLTVGGLSLLVHPQMMLSREPWPIVYLMASPMLAGGLAVLVAKWRARRGDPLYRIDHFVYAAIFAFAIALVRFGYAAR